MSVRASQPLPFLVTPVTQTERKRNSTSLPHLGLHHGAGQTYQQAPEPTTSLKNRLKATAITDIRTAAKRSDMKSVDRTPKDFDGRFSGLPAEDLLSHLDKLERERATKFMRTPQEFYWGLRSTLTGKSFETLQAMEEYLESMSFANLIPRWFEPEPEEWRELYEGLPDTQLCL